MTKLTMLFPHAVSGTRRVFVPCLSALSASQVRA